ncbi:MAG: hypothetical protein BWY74_02025 [Firmicutes bacterium ADurb.Bin419]|nr:MAG: hypothetical protein BWY74_02025 [Firmicutes bacterium ADurb.Bin419]
MIRIIYDNYFNIEKTRINAGFFYYPLQIGGKVLKYLKVLIKMNKLGFVSVKF